MFLNLKVPRGSLDDELAAVRDEISADATPVYLPAIFLKMGLETIRSIEGQHHLDAEPRVGIDMALAARACAHAQSRLVAGLADIAAALPPALIKNTPPAHASHMPAWAEQWLPNSARYLQREIPDCDFASLIKKMHAACGAGAPITSEAIKQVLLVCGDFQELESLCRWAIKHETLPNFRIHEVIAEYMRAYTEGIAQELQARGRKYTK